MTTSSSTRLLALSLALTLLLIACDPKVQPRIPPKASGTETVDISQFWALNQPGGAIAVSSKTLGRPIVITRDKEGQLRTFDSWCPHGACSVRPGQGGDLECPCHESHFDSDGNHISGPSPIGLIEYAHEQHGDTLIVNFSQRTVRDKKGNVVDEG